MKRLVLLSIAAVVLSGCGTLILPAPVDVQVNSDPPGSTITVDSNVMGITPMQIPFDNN